VLADLAEAETANSALVANILLGEIADDAEDIEETSLTDELSALSLDLHNRWDGALDAATPQTATSAPPNTNADTRSRTPKISTMLPCSRKP
jgi:hypothetical protein